MSVFNYENKQDSNYFEGWYLRLTDVNNNLNYAIIFALTKYKEDPHAFIQVLDNTKNKTYYYRFKDDEFKSSNNEIRINDNTISPNYLKLFTDDFDLEVTIDNHTFLQAKKNKKASAMGFLKNFPLPCFQDVIFLDAIFIGEAVIDGKIQQINGKAYMEKTYGNKFPEKWIWVQSNHSLKKASFTLALGIIPVLFLKIKGFFCILNYDGIEYKFAIYNRARIKVTKISINSISITIKKGKYRINLIVDSVNPLELLGPALNGEMNLKVLESVASKMTLKFYKGNHLILDDQTGFVGFENMFFN